MANMTLAVPDDLHVRMRKHSHIKWGDVARKAFEDQLAREALIEKLLAEDKKVEKITEEIGNKIKRATREHFDALRRRQQSDNRRAH